MKLNLSGFVLFVDDIAKSKDFYSGVLGQEVLIDIGGINIGFKGGLALWEKKYAQNNIFGKAAGSGKSDDVEIYFETAGLDEVFARVSLSAKPLHPVKVQPWQQRVFRVYDPDGFIVEVAETMDSVVRRLRDEGLDVEEISQKSMMPREAVEAMLSQ
ncbi:MAG: VOC family protein [Spirochaetota bacterium]